MSSYYSVRELRNYFDRRIGEQELITYADDLDGYDQHLKEDVDRIAKEALHKIELSFASVLCALDDDEVLVLQRHPDIDVCDSFYEILDSIKVR